MNSIRSPTDHFTYQRQVNPFIVMKWGSVMYYGCERLNPVLSFLWGRQIRAHIRSVEKLKNYQSNSDAEIEQHTLKEICICVCVCFSWRTSVPRSVLEYCISAQDLSNSAQIYGKNLVSGFVARVGSSLSSDEELQVWVHVFPRFKICPRIDLQAVTVPLMAPVFCGSWSVSQQQCFLSLPDKLAPIRSAITGMDKRGRIRAFHSSWWELNTKAEEMLLKRDWNNPSKAGLFPLIKGLWNTQKNENWFDFDASSSVFVTSKKRLKSIFLYLLILPFINQIELGDELNQASSRPLLVPALRPSPSSTLAVWNSGRPLSRAAADW